ncbi:MAG: hypothetical protein DRI57_16635 [Deltaproteobacteria bacterium]|nr:MAG: hypothetical protein DRI57_16635 [Deltaproteobacteria bacterium]
MQISFRTICKIVQPLLSDRQINHKPGTAVRIFSHNIAALPARAPDEPLISADYENLKLPNTR